MKRCRCGSAKTAQWATAYAAVRQRDLSDQDDGSSWGDGVHGTIRLADERLGTLVVIGVRADGTQAVMAVEDGDRASTERWLTLVRELTRRGMTAPAVAVGAGALSTPTKVMRHEPQ